MSALQRLAVRLLLSLLPGVTMLIAGPAEAVPSFALQTGQPCSACHVGAFGPQLTAFGRAFKIGGYTQTGGNGWQAAVPVSVQLFGTYTDTGKGLGRPAAQHYGANGNFAMDQASIFLAGRINDYAGGMSQFTLNGISSGFNVDNTDLRVSAPFDLGGRELRLGLDVNNGPTVQDPFNGSYAWGYPYVASKFAPTPAAQPLLAGGLAGNSIGATVYGWFDRSLYVEGGLYNTFGPSVLNAFGDPYGPGSTANPAPYVRVAYEWNWNGQSAYVGGIFLRSNLSPATASFKSDGSMGKNSYTDYAMDAGYQYMGDGTHTASITGIFNHEEQHLASAFNAGTSSKVGNSLNQARANVNYYYQQTYGATVGWQKSWGSTNPLLYAPGPLSGSNNGRPDSNAFIFELDWVPFGKADSWMGPWANLKLGAQYTLYTQFNGGTRNYDGNGRNASDNNTIYLFAWLIF